MTSPIDPIRNVSPDRQEMSSPGATDRPDEAGGQAEAQQTLPAVTTQPRPETSGALGAAAALAAQLLGQGGQKRGLKGGPPVIKGARAAYLEAEWSGPNDRRKPAGKITRTEI